MSTPVSLSQSTDGSKVVDVSDEFLPEGSPRQIVPDNLPTFPGAYALYMAKKFRPPVTRQRKKHRLGDGFKDEQSRGE